MEPYKNISGHSGIIAFQTGVDEIKIQFVDGSIYQYTSGVAGNKNIKKMKKLAVSGQGLATFISTTIRTNYTAKLK